jgi:large subunit ribosomal protein L15e
MAKKPGKKGPVFDRTTAFWLAPKTWEKLLIIMSLSKQVRETIQSELAGKKNADYNYRQLYLKKVQGFRNAESAVERIERPSNLPRARSLGYKAKQGILLARVGIRKGSGKHTRPFRGRRPKRMGIKKLTRRMNIQAMAERRVADKYPNCEVLNSYKVGEDGQQHYFEVILVDTSHPAILADKNLCWICGKEFKGRAYRGLTSAGKKHRGMKSKKGKGKGTEKVRPSARAHGRMSK